ncbi:MAG: hypothetical protein ACQEQN_10675 [Thermodesulfobacteriota bacterium]
MSTVAILSRHVNESRKIAEKTAFQLGYPLVTMEDLVKDAAKEGNVPESELSGSLKGMTLYRQFFRKRKIIKLVSLMELKLCEHMVEKPIVFCGYLGYSIFREISHVLDVLVLSHPGGQKDEKGQKGGAKPFVDDAILKWFHTVYNVNMENPNLYDLSINLKHMDESEGADVIVNTLGQRRFTPTTYSRKMIKDLELALRIKTKLIEKLPDVQVKTHDSTAYIYSKSFRRGKQKAIETKQAIMWMDGVDYVEIYKNPKYFEEL